MSVSQTSNCYFDQIKTYPETNEITPGANFVGGNNTKNSLLKVEKGDQDRFIKGNFVQTKGGFTEIGDWVPYTQEPIFDGFDTTEWGTSPTGEHID